jgi:predicted phosphate transport protein (TIGR00153 family)
MFGLVPKNENFFEFFDRAALNILEGARLLDELIEDAGDVEERAKLIKDLEHVGDTITHETVKMLNKTFVTPIDREDIHALISALDDVMDIIESVAIKIRLYKIREFPLEARELAHILLKSAEETVRAVSYLEKMDHTIHHICIELNSLENEADRISRSAIAKLFDEEKDPITLIKMKELYETLEWGSDKFEDVANILEGIVVKHA